MVFEVLRELKSRTSNRDTHGSQKMLKSFARMSANLMKDFNLWIFMKTKLKLFTTGVIS